MSGDRTSTAIMPPEPPYEMANLFADLIVPFENVETDENPDPVAALCSEEGWGWLEYLALALTSRGYRLVKDEDQNGSTGASDA